MIARGLEVLENSVRNATGTLRGQLDRPGVSALGEIAEVLRQEDGEQTTRMAVTIIANALTVHDGVASAHESVPSLAELARGGPIGKEQTLAAWERILAINYWPIFEVARDLLTCIPEAEAGNLIEDLRAAADELARLGITTTQDLAGQMFGRLIADRKFLATFYTRPASAALLAELAVARLDADWSDAESVEALRIADLACGTGALLSAAYRAVAARRRRAGGDDRESAPPDDGAVADRRRHHARRRAPHRLDALQRAARPALRAHAHLHDAVRARRRPGAFAIGSLDLIKQNRAACAVRDWPERARHGRGRECDLAASRVAQPRHHESAVRAADQP